jgi:hypothetical protein
MFDYQKCVIEPFAKSLREAYQRTYGLLKPEYGTFIEWAGHLSLEIISNSDALYHNIDHTMMVTLAGQEILIGKHLTEGGVTPENWLNFMIAVLCHDIGYVRGICRDDRDHVCATGIDGRQADLSPGGTDASLTSFHVDRSKLFIRERFGGKLLLDLDAEVVASYIEMTRFPVPEGDFYQDTKGFRGLVRAADFIGQLGDPNYLRKITALFYEFEETGANKAIGYKNPGDMRKTYAKFFWNVVSPYIQDAIRHLGVTLEGKQWIANLYSHVFSVEHNHI